MRDLKYGKAIKIIGLVGLLETTLWILLIILVKDNVMISFTDFLRLEEELLEVDIKAINQIITTVLTVTLVWGGVIAVAIAILSFFAKNSLAVNIALLALTVLMGLGGITAIIMIVFVIMNIIDASKRNKENQSMADIAQ